MKCEQREAGDILCRQGDDSAHWFVILSGSVSLLSTSDIKALQAAVKAIPLLDEPSAAFTSSQPSPNVTAGKATSGGKLSVFKTAKENGGPDQARLSKYSREDSLPTNVFRTEFGSEILARAQQSESATRQSSDEGDSSVRHMGLAASGSKRISTQRGRTQIAKATANPLATSLSAGKPQVQENERTAEYRELVLQSSQNIADLQQDMGLGPDNSYGGDLLRLANIPYDATMVCLETSWVGMVPKTFFRDVVVKHSLTPMLWTPGRLQEAAQKAPGCRSPEDTDMLMTLMQSNTLFERLSFAELHELASVVTVHHPQHAELLWQQGEQAADVYAVCHGEVKLYSGPSQEPCGPLSVTMEEGAKAQGNAADGRHITLPGLETPGMSVEPSPTGSASMKKAPCISTLSALGATDEETSNAKPKLAQLTPEEVERQYGKEIDILPPGKFHEEKGVNRGQRTRDGVQHSCSAIMQAKSWVVSLGAFYNTHYYQLGLMRHDLDDDSVVQRLRHILEMDPDNRSDADIQFTLRTLGHDPMVQDGCGGHPSELARVMHLAELPANDSVLLQGDLASQYCIILSGTVHQHFSATMCPNSPATMRPAKTSRKMIMTTSTQFQFRSKANSKHDADGATDIGELHQTLGPGEAFGLEDLTLSTEETYSYTFRTGKGGASCVVMNTDEMRSISQAMATQGELDEAVNFLSGVPLLKPCTRQQRTGIAKLLTLSTYNRNVEVLQYGAKAGDVFFVKSGMLTLTVPQEPASESQQEPAPEPAFPAAPQLRPKTLHSSPWPPHLDASSLPWIDELTSWCIARGVPGRILELSFSHDQGNLSMPGLEIAKGLPQSGRSKYTQGVELKHASHGEGRLQSGRLSSGRLSSGRLSSGRMASGNGGAGVQLTMVGPGSIVGETAVLKEVPQPASVVCSSACELYTMRAEDFIRKLPAECMEKCMLELGSKQDLRQERVLKQRHAMPLLQSGLCAPGPALADIPKNAKQNMRKNAEALASEPLPPPATPTPYPRCRWIPHATPHRPQPCPLKTLSVAPTPCPGC
ncbi:hypothetical protein CYMTET_22256 [Cymbomonas tetramitiformis]|uniref:Cyclic nucleotide-binding domain-containing protein n=1 Tax=Cymbomonas tetramitiformis TaxID=36881 RepID=A0AAE0L2D6_9CHLO|nr:hypothetical protein CYMTET_22256 [Cymbomonas tetramitiformis]